ncbi:MAG: response regulator [Planctomycetaceae bacterium]|nr:response regulator [Planctomycetales bacterium]MCB9921548.1 response regulator [Planctomycetaceae bacterium]
MSVWEGSLNAADVFHVLLVEDNPLDARLVIRLLEAVASPRFHVQHAERLHDAVELLSQREFHVVLLDLMMPDCNRLEGLERLSGDATDIPIIVLTGVADEGVALAALRRGAEDYLVKGEAMSDAMLVRSIRYGVERKRAEVEIRELNTKLEERVARRTAQLRASEERYRNVVEGQTELIVRWLPDGTHTFVNDAYCRYFNKTSEELLGKSFFPWMSSDEEREALRNRVASITVDNPVARGEHQGPGPDGETRWQRWTERGIFDEAGHLIELQSVGQDITEQKLTEGALRRAERLASIGTMAAGIAHEINNPIAAALNAAEAAMRFKDDPEAKHLLERCLDNVVRSAHRCRLIVENVLKFARQEPTERSLVDINTVVRDARVAALPHAERENATLDLQLTDDLPPVWINKIEIEQVLTNLLDNASRSADGPIQVIVRTALTKDGIGIFVEDNGPGMDHEQRQRAFDPFYSTRQKQGGTGLGLSIAHGIIQSHGGRIEISSEPGQGTTIIVDLPIRADDVKIEGPQTQSSTAPT